MQTAPLDHMQFNVRGENLPFYRDLLTFLGWNLIGEWPGMIGLGSLASQSLWFSGQVKEVANDYDGPGLNHLAFAAASIANVDEAVAWLQARGVAALFETRAIARSFPPTNRAPTTRSCSRRRTAS